jgi:ADP-heptose:LPS heptosyltransferase
MKTGLQLPALARRLIAARLARPATVRAGARHRRACIYKVDRVGDLVLALGALHRLVQHYGSDECRLVVSDVAAPLAAAEFPHVPRWEVPADAAGVWRDIRPWRGRLAPEWARETFDEIVCLRHTRSLWRDVSMSWIHARAWRGLGERPERHRVFTGHRPALDSAYPAHAGPPWSRELLAHRDVVGRVTGTVPGWAELHPHLESVAVTRGDDWVLCPFGHDPIRDYPAERWAEAWRIAAVPAGVIRVIGPATRAVELEQLAARLRAVAGRARVDVESNLSLPDFIARLAGARGIVTVESAAAHLATAFDKPAVVVLGGGHFEWLSPWGERRRQEWVCHRLPCYGCNWQCGFPTVHCLAELPAATVASALQEAFSHG